MAGAGWKFTELVGSVAGSPSDSPANLRAFSSGGHIHTGRGRLTVIAVGISITAANRIPYLITTLRTGLATAHPVITDAHAFGAVFIIA